MEIYVCILYLSKYFSPDVNRS